MASVNAHKWVVLQLHWMFQEFLEFKKHLTMRQGLGFTLSTVSSSQHHTLRRMLTNWNKFRGGQQGLSGMETKSPGMEAKSYEERLK